MDSFELNRNTMLQNYETLSATFFSRRNKNQLSLFEDEIVEPEIQYFEEFDNKKKRENCKRSCSVLIFILSAKRHNVSMLKFLSSTRKQRNF